MPVFVSETSNSNQSFFEPDPASFPHLHVQNIRIANSRASKRPSIRPNSPLQSENLPSCHHIASNLTPSTLQFNPMTDSNSVDQASLDDSHSVSSSVLLPGLPRSVRPPSVTIPYKSSPNPFHTLDLYLPASGLAPDTPWFIFLHGGYWSDATQSKDVGSIILTRLPSHWAAASIDYRLSPEVSYPGHLNDVKQALKFLKNAYNVRTAVVMAHGAGACIAYQYLFAELCSNNANWIRHVITSGGVYDLMSLANDSPYYQKYIEDAFGRDRLNWYDLSPQNFEWSQLTPEYTEHEQHEDSSTNTTNTQMPHARHQNNIHNTSRNSPPHSSSPPIERRSALADAIEEMRSRAFPTQPSSYRINTTPSTPTNASTASTSANTTTETTTTDSNKYIDKIRMEATIIHSKFDTIVPIQQSLRFDEKLQSAGFNVSFRLLSINGHDNVLETSELVTIALDVCNRIDEKGDQEPIYEH